MRIFALAISLSFGLAQAAPPERPAQAPPRPATVPSSWPASQAHTTSTTPPLTTIQRGTSPSTSEARKPADLKLSCIYGVGGDPSLWNYGGPCYGMTSRAVPILPGRHEVAATSYVAKSQVLLEQPETGEEVAQLSWEEVRVTPGSHTISFRAPGYKPLDVRFDAAAPGPFGGSKSFLQIRVQPEDATVYLDGARLGTAAELAKLDGAISIEREAPASVDFTLIAKNP